MVRFIVSSFIGLTSHPCTSYIAHHSQRAHKSTELKLLGAAVSRALILTNFVLPMVLLLGGAP